MYTALGHAALKLGEATLAVLCIANPVGDIVDPETAEIVAGARLPDGGFARHRLEYFATPQSDRLAAQNTTLVVVATDAVISKAQAKALAESAHVGIAQVTRPSHTPFDGDSCFVLSTATQPLMPIHWMIPSTA